MIVPQTFPSANRMLELLIYMLNGMPDLNRDTEPDPVALAKFLRALRMQAADLLGLNYQVVLAQFAVYLRAALTGYGHFTIGRVDGQLMLAPNDHSIVTVGIHPKHERWCVEAYALDDEGNRTRELLSEALPLNELVCEPDVLLAAAMPHLVKALEAARAQVPV